MNLLCGPRSNIWTWKQFLKLQLQDKFKCHWNCFEPDYGFKKKKGIEDIFKGTLLQTCFLTKKSSCWLATPHLLIKWYKISVMQDKWFLEICFITLCLQLTILYTYKSVKKVDIMLSVLTTIKIKIKFSC